MKFGLIGFGKMGQAIKAIVDQSEHTIAGIVSSRNQNWSLLKDADVWLDFSDSSSVLEHVDQAIRYKKNILIGTTGWLAKLPQIKDKLSDSEIGVLYAPNCSIAMILFMHTLAKTVADYKTFFPSLSLEGLEIHHTEKKDAPSGTALEISEQIQSSTELALDWESERKKGAVGTHQVQLNLPCDTLSFKHEAKSRFGFASGAIDAACWLHQKKGIYTLNDYLQEMIDANERSLHSPSHSISK